MGDPRHVPSDPPAMAMDGECLLIEKLNWEIEWIVNWLHGLLAWRHEAVHKTTNSFLKKADKRKLLGEKEAV
jgi:hypothetical protein